MTVFRLVPRSEDSSESETCPFSIVVGSISPLQKVVVSDVLSSSLRNRNRLFLSDGVFDSRNQLSSATKHLFQLCDGHSPLGPREVVVEGNDLLQACCVISGLCCNTRVVRFDEFGETHSAKEPCVVSLLVIRLHCESGLNL